MGKSIGKNVRKQMVIVAALVLILLLLAVVILLPKITGTGEPKAEVITVSTLEKIIDVSELSTSTTVYNGIAQVMNPKKPDQVDYYVSYEARVDAGIDFEEIRITVDDETKIAKISVPDVYITDINVDISSMDFIFYNDKADSATITQEAYKVCEADVQAESAQQSAILELAQQNAVNFITALVKPIIEQMDETYSLVVE